MKEIYDPIALKIGEWATGIGFYSMLFRFFLAIVMGAVIGCERSVKRHSAGLRTFIIAMVSGTGVMLLDCLLCLETGTGYFVLSAAFLLALASISIHAVFYSSRNEIKGLTTAAALWLAGLLGLLIGAGFYTAALILFAVFLCTLLWLPAFEALLKNHSNHFEIHLELKDSVYLQDFVTTIRKLGLSIDEIELNHAYAGSGLSVYSIAISIRSGLLHKYKTHAEIIEALSTLEYIYYIEEMHV